MSVMKTIIPISKPDIGPEEIHAVIKVLTSGMLAQGQKVAEFETTFAKYCGTKHAIACNNGTSALLMSLLSSLDLDPFFEPPRWKDRPEVITTPFTFIATANSIITAGAKPVFVDIGPHTFNIDSELIEEAITNKTIAIMPVHLFGLPCDMSEILQIARDHDLKVIEDACQAHGAEYKGKKVGGIGHAGAFSFYPTKNMTTGEGGMVTTNDAEVAEKCRMMRNQGQTSSGPGAHRPTYDYKMIGFNWRMTDIAAAIGIVQQKKLPKAIDKRKANAKLYDECLTDISNIEIPFVPKNRKHVYHQYTIKVINEKRNQLRELLKKKGIETGVYYPSGLYNSPICQNRTKQTAKDFPNTERTVREVLSLPVHPLVSKFDLNQIVIEIMKKFCSKKQCAMQIIQFF